MRGGDISNEVPKRVIVTLDCILDRRSIVKTSLGGLIKLPTEEVTYNRQSLASFWRWSNNNPFSMELTGFGYTRKEMREVQEDLDNMGTNPFNYYTGYATISDLVGELPYRPDVVYVIDIPSRSLRWGAKYVDIGGYSGGRQ